MSLSAADARDLERCVAAGGVAVFPADTVYGLACDPRSPAGVARLYALKGRAAGKPAAVMFFDRDVALAALADLGPRTRAALRALLPAGLTVLVPNLSGDFAPACGEDPGTLGVRVPVLSGSLAALAAVATPVLQSSANPAGEPDARRLADVDAAIRAGADLVLDGGTLPGTPSTVIDLRCYEHRAEWSVLRAGAAPEDSLRAVLGAPIVRLP